MANKNTAAKGMTMTQKILADHAGLERVEAGQLIKARLDMVLGNDITTPVAVKEFRKIGRDRVFDREKIAIVPDHFTPNKDIKSAEQARLVREFAREMDIENYFEVGRMGVEHALLPEKGLVVPGDVVIGADSHTCTYGTLGAFSTGVGSTDMAAGMATGEAWFKVPEAIRFVLAGKPGRWVSGKDIILHIIGMIGVDGALYKSMEFTGDGLAYLSMDDRFSMANMAIEAGAKNGIFDVDEKTIEYVREHSTKPYKVYKADEDAVYCCEYTIDLGAVKPTVAFPHLPSNARTIDEVGDIKIDQVVIGSCTNGRLEDMRVAARVLKGRTVHPGVRCIIIPATQKIWKQAMDEGLFDIFIEAGAAVSTPTCGPCLGGHMGILAKGEKAVATTNRNFVGRMGHPESEVYLASPAIAAASAVAGRIASPDEL
jgi:3-isopropylmalate/(R)-2-methylmalate dehydratase large subunit